MKITKYLTFDFKKANGPIYGIWALIGIWAFFQASPCLGRWGILSKGAAATGVIINKHVSTTSYKGQVFSDEYIILLRYQSGSGQVWQEALPVAADGYDVFYVGQSIPIHVLDDALGMRVTLDNDYGYARQLLVGLIGVVLLIYVGSCVYQNA